MMNSRPPYKIRAFLLLLAAVGMPQIVQAASCNANGKIFYLGNVNNQNRSVWVSATTGGDFYIEAKNAEIDRWNRAGSGAHLTLSDVVSPGNGGTHKLYAADGNKNCLLDTRNQVGGISLPPNWRPPEKPPEGLMPERPTVPRPPTGVMPELPTIPQPPTGITPGRPTIPQPPTGVMPERPTVPQPPTGITPELPTIPQPPTGVMPERPTIPRPPTGVMPELPTVPQPPTGITPERPTSPQPPTGIRPERPTVPRPPTGIRPERPTVPRPPTGVMPELPINPSPPVGIVRPEGNGGEGNAGLRTTIAPTLPCAGRVGESGLGDTAQLGPCAGPAETSEKQVPLTPGRDLVAESPWNAWIDTRYLTIKDQRGLSESKTRGGTITLGTDRRVGDGLVAGGMLSLMQTENERFTGYVTQDTSGFMLGPYLSYRLSDEWSLFASATIGSQRDEHKVVSLSGDSSATLYALTANTQGQYEVGTETYLRPKLGFSYQHNAARAFDLSGRWLGQALKVDLAGQNTDSLIADASLELNSILRGEKERLYMPFVEAGVRYTRLWPEVSGSALKAVSGVDWQGILRVGGRALLGSTTQIELNASYQSIGVSNLDIWEAGFFVSHAF